MIFAEYYDCNLRPLCGDRSVFILDGRNRRDTQIADARAFGRKHPTHRFFRICRGATFCREVHPLTKVLEVPR